MWYTSLLTEFDKTLNDYTREIDDVLKVSEVCTQYCQMTIAKLRDKFLGIQNISVDQEIDFFKNIKPLFLSRLIYHLRVYNIETNKPHGALKIKRKYLQLELNKLKYYFDENLEFYRYYRTGSNYLDHKYFVRGNQDIRLSLDTHVFELDPDYCTSHDFKVSTILANDLLQIYLENEMTNLDFKTSVKALDTSMKSSLRWTSSKAALIELMYALHQSGSFNNGQTDVKKIATYFESIFDIELGNYYRTYLELRIRHNPTKFLDSLQESLLRKMEEDDEK